MITSMISRLLAASAYRKVIAVLLAGCAAGFVLGQAAHQAPSRGIAAAVTSPARTAAVISGALGTPVVAPPPVIVPLSAPTTRPGNGGAHGDHGHVRDADPHNHVPPRAMPLGKPGHGHDDGGNGGNGDNGGGDTSTPASPLSGGASVVTATLSVSN